MYGQKNIKLVFHMNGITQVEDSVEQGAEEDNWTLREENNNGLEKTAIRGTSYCTPIKYYSDKNTEELDGRGM